LQALNASLLYCLNFLPWLTLYRFIASRICLNCLNALTNKNINAKKGLSNDLHWQSLKNPYILRKYCGKAKNFVVFALTHVSGSHVLFYEDFGTNS
jgi:hypothetical protein